MNNDNQINILHYFKTKWQNINLFSDQHTFGKLRHVTDTETASRTSSVDTDYG